ncbi:MAG TPA: XRE family transcriptional regulator [Actinomycetales bacterium]|nr:XRE family transcriptional regulator [Actinomycetales bacterium]
MANERLRSAIVATGRDYQSVAERIGVDPKTVERWVLRDRTPHRTHRQATAALLGKDETYLWPCLLTDPTAQAPSRAEVLQVYPTRGAVPLDLWVSVIADATREVTLLSYAGLFLLDNNPDITELIAGRAKAGVRVRILLGDPDADAIRQRGQEEGIGADMRGRVRIAQKYLRPALGTPGLEVRLHSTTLYNSIYRGDDTMLVNMHLYGSGAPANPVMHLQRVTGGRLFASYLRSIDAVWEQGVPTTEF